MENNPMEKLDSKLQTAYDRFVPHDFFRLLGKKDITQVKLGDQVERTMTILFSDIRDFTTLSEDMSPQDNFNFINSYFSRMEPAISNNKGIIDKFIGDAIMALFPGDADDALKAALEMLKVLGQYNMDRKKSGYKKIGTGIGLNSGHLMLGTVGGHNRMQGTVISDAVNLASRIETMTKNYGVSLIISEHTLHSLKNPENYSMRFLDRVMVKGKMRPQSVYEAFDNDAFEVKNAKLKSKNIFEEALACYHQKKIKEAETMLEKCLALCPDDAPAKMYADRCKRYTETGIHEGSGEIDREIAWDKSMETGVDRIDRQHRELFEHTNSLLNAIREDKNQNEVNDVISFLNEYIKKHFRDEVMIMQEHNYPFVSFQKEQHQNFVNSFEDLKNKVSEMRENKSYLMFRFQILVVDWLINHTIREDMHFGKYLRYLKEE